MRQLRREVGYGCPFPGCGEPFLTWHHFDPPWNVRNHFDPDGMIALCMKHHRVADAKLVGIDDLRSYKSTPPGPPKLTEFSWMAPPVSA